MHCHEGKEADLVQRIAGFPNLRRVRIGIACNVPVQLPVSSVSHNEVNRADGGQHRPKAIIAREHGEARQRCVDPDLSTCMLVQGHVPPQHGRFAMRTVDIPNCQIGVGQNEIHR